MITAVRSLFGFAAFSARSFSNPGQLIVASPVSPNSMNPRRDTGPAQRTWDDGWMMEDKRRKLRERMLRFIDNPRDANASRVPMSHEKDAG
jgi:hypothetical protein